MSSWNRITPGVQNIRNKSTFVTIILKGGLGNRIFQVLAAQHFAEKTGRTFVIDNAHIHSNPHENPEDTMAQLTSIFPTLTYYNGPFQGWKLITEEEYMMFQYQTDIFKKFPGQNIILDGYFFNSRYFPKQIPQLNIDKKFYSTFFLHIRMGDYKNSVHDINFTTYHKNSITTAIKNDTSIKFLVFSDEPERADEYLKSLDLPQFKYSFSTAKKSLDVLKEMASCVGGICANSSLSYLGAFFQKPRGSIYMPNVWMKNISRNQFNDFYPLWATVVETKPPTLNY